MDEALKRLLREDIYPGNCSAFQDACAAIQSNNALAFTGAGTSAPQIPTWGGILHNIISHAKDSGAIDSNDAASLLQQMADDPLDVADSLEEALLTDKFRTLLSSYFNKPDLCTVAHESLMAIPFQGFITLNYDPGLSNAYVRYFSSLPQSHRSSERFELSRWTQGQSLSVSAPPILHWHGVPSAPEEMIFTGKDYNRFYGVRENVNFLQGLFRTQRLIVVGFGFKDPFLTRGLEETLRDLASDDRHFAFIGRSDEEPVSLTMRRSFSRKYKVRPIFYCIKKDESGNLQDHSELIDLLRKMPARKSNGENSAVESIVKDIEKESVDIYSEPQPWAQNLFVGYANKLLYVEPRLIASNALLETDFESEPDALNVDDIVVSDKSFVIHAPHEYGLTTLGRRLANQLSTSGHLTIFREANSLPNYQKRLLSELGYNSTDSIKEEVIILDGFDGVNHERLLKEIRGIKRFKRIILLTKTESFSVQDDDDAYEADYISLRLSNINRSGIRTLARQMSGSADQDYISGVVEKVYNDLLQLCIPLTPTNVIMYLSILHREGDFAPLSRLQIIDKYIRELLRRPGDAYRDSFNVDNKLDVLSSFVNSLYKKDMVSFTETEWAVFCSKYMSRTLINFDWSALLNDLAASRVLQKSNAVYIFRYRLFYSYLLGRYVANRPKDLKEFLANNDHMQVEGLIEVISGLSADNTELVKNLTKGLNDAIDEFYNQYNIRDLNPYDRLEWTYSEEVEAAIWKDITESLEQGPDAIPEIDKLKRSIEAERKTELQSTIIMDFKEREKSVTLSRSVLMTAINNAVDVEGSLKVNAIQAIVEASKIVVRIGFIFSPLIAEQKRFTWNEMNFVNRIRYDPDIEFDAQHRAGLVASVIPTSIVNQSTEVLGSKKLAEVFVYMSQNLLLSGFEQYINFAMILRSKPKNWGDVAHAILSKTEKRSLFLRFMLDTSMRQYRQEVNTNSERLILMKIVAYIKAKRDLNKTDPGAKAVSTVLTRLREAGYFHVAPDSEPE